MTGIIKDIIRFFSTRQALFSEILSQDDIIKLQMDKIMSSIKELDQDKVYFIVVKETDEANAQINRIFNSISKNMNWTPPRIIVSTDNLHELSKNRLRKLLKELDKK